METQSDKVFEAIIENAKMAKMLRQIAGIRPTAAEQISEFIERTDESTTDGSLDHAAESLSEMVVAAIGVRYSKSAHLSWVHGSTRIAHIDVHDDGESIARLTGYGATTWDAAVNLAMAAGYFTPTDH